MIYVDNAATTKLDPEAFEAMKPFMLDYYGNASQPYSFSRKNKQALKDSRLMIAKCINASPDEIYFTSGGTESDNWAIKGFGSLSVPRTIITSTIEHHAVLNSCETQISLGTSIRYLPVDKNGAVSITELEANLVNLKQQNGSCDNTLVSVMLANNEIGTIEPICEVAETTHKYAAIVHTDAVQAIGHIPIDIKSLEVDMMSASAHKFNGPKGIGFLYVRNGIKLRSHNTGGGQEFGLRAGTENVAAIVGMAVALENNCRKLDNEKDHLLMLENHMLSQLRQNGLDFIRNGGSNHLPGNISLSFKNAEGEMLLHRLDLMGICVSTGSACDSNNTQISHVIKAIDVPEEYAKGTIRISLGKENDEKDIDEIAVALAKILNV